MLSEMLEVWPSIPVTLGSDSYHREWEIHEPAIQVVGVVKISCVVSEYTRQLNHEIVHAIEHELVVVVCYLAHTLDLDKLIVYSIDPLQSVHGHG